jgi:hypothetical protein
MIKIRTLAVAAFLGLTLTLAGCGAQPGKTVVKYDDGISNQVFPAPASATYNLYASRDLEPVVSLSLEKGEDIGFRAGTTEDSVVAVAGNREVELDGKLLSTYRWKQQKD